MSLTIEFELSEDDLKHFKELAKKAKSAAKQADDETILQGVERLLGELRDAKLPKFIKDRVSVIETMKTMLEDRGFNLPAPERKRVITALAYFLDPDDLIADEIPVLGFLDDAIMIELVRRELEHELQGYHDFCEFREKEARRRGEEVTIMDRAKWMDDKRTKVIERIRSRRSRATRRGGRSPFSLF